MGKTYTLQLATTDLDQLLESLRSRSEAWHGTAGYLATGVTPRDDFIIEECSDADEARAIAADYDRIIASIETQRNAQRPLF
jgi:hypothetical protein